jgi:hypothetical protein
MARERLRLVREVGHQGGLLVIQKIGGNDSSIFNLDRVFLFQGSLVEAFEEPLGTWWEIRRIRKEIALDLRSIEIQNVVVFRPREIRSHAPRQREEESQACEEGGEECH